jgi:hypothetical protein
VFFKKKIGKEEIVDEIISVGCFTAVLRPCIKDIIIASDGKKPLEVQYKAASVCRYESHAKERQIPKNHYMICDYSWLANRRIDAVALYHSSKSQFPRSYCSFFDL